MMSLLIIALSCGEPASNHKGAAWGGKSGFVTPSVVLISAEAVADTTVEEDSAAVQLQVKEMSIQADGQIEKMDKLIAELKKQ